MRVPRSLELYRDTRKLAVFPPYILLAVVGVLSLEWWGVAALVGSLLLAAIILLWGGAINLEDENRELEATADEALEAEARVLELEIENERLLAQRAAPSLSLPQLLHSVDKQRELVDRVRKHRELASDGLLEWPVTSIRQVASGELRVTAHVPDGANRLINEPLALVETSTDQAIAVSTPTPTGENILELDFSTENVPDELEEAMASHQLPPEGFVVRLVGLHFEPYNSLSQEQLASLATGLRGTADAISQALMPPGQPPYELEEGNA